MALDHIPGDANLYIGGLISMRRKAALQSAHITHVVSAVRLPLDQDLFVGFKHHVVELDDVEDENMLEQIPASNAFIQEGLDGGGGVLVHCAMGKSRSTALLMAHLLRTYPHHTPTTALALIREARPFAEPNPGFLCQLDLYHRMSCPPTQEALDAHPLYQRWLYQRTVEVSIAAGMAPEVTELRFGDEGTAAPTNLAAEEGTAASEKMAEPSKSYRCRRCRTHLAASTYLVPHSPSVPPASPPCAHLHIMPLSWMRPELEQGKLEGRLECPNRKCGQSVGRYAWQGIKCNCGEWVVPGMTLGRGRVDEVRERSRGCGGKM